MHTLEEKQVGRFDVKVHLDDCYMDLGDVLGDEPILIFTRDRHWTHVQHDGTKDVTESIADVLRVAEESYSWTDVLDEMDADWTWTDGGTLKVDSSSLPRVRYFKDAEKAVRSIFRADYGKEFSDFRLERFSTRDAEVYAIWCQSEMDRYAGTKDAKAPLETIQAFLDGDVYGFTVEDADGDVLESCWGFIGDWTYCMAEGEAVARHLEGEASETDARRLEDSRPDLYVYA